MPTELTIYLLLAAGLLLILGFWTADWLNRVIGRAVAWLTVLMLGVTVFDVVLRKQFNSGSIAMQELEWHLFALLFLFGAGYTLAEDSHVRVDIFYSKLPARLQAAVNILGTLMFLLPFCTVIFYTSLPFIWSSYQLTESSDQPGGLPYRFLIKSAMPLGVLFVAMQGVFLLRANFRQLIQGSRMENLPANKGPDS